VSSAFGALEAETRAGRADRNRRWLQVQLTVEFATGASRRRHGRCDGKRDDEGEHETKSHVSHPKPER
jgi:hypothetical protein